MMISRKLVGVVVTLSVAVTPTLVSCVCDVLRRRTYVMLWCCVFLLAAATFFQDTCVIVLISCIDGSHGYTYTWGTVL